MIVANTDCHISVRPVKVTSLPRRRANCGAHMGLKAMVVTAITPKTVMMTVFSRGRIFRIAFAKRKWPKMHAKQILPVALFVIKIKKTDKIAYTIRDRLKNRFFEGAYSTLASRNEVVMEHRFF